MGPHKNSRGRGLKGAVPLRFELTQPDGALSDLSHFSVLQDGQWRFQWRMPNGTVESKKLPDHAPVLSQVRPSGEFALPS